MTHTRSDAAGKASRRPGPFARLYALFPWTTITGGAIAAVCIVIVLIMAWNASHDNALVIKPFGVPPDLQKTGLTGDVAAAHFLDQLSELDQQAHEDQRDVIITTDPDFLTAEHRDTRIADIKIQIPHTDVSIGDLDQFLRQWLGHRKVITADIVQTPKGPLTTVRSDATPAVRDLYDPATGKFPQKLIDESYGQFQPFLYANYLVQQKTSCTNSKAADFLAALLGRQHGSLTRDEAAWASWALATLRAQEPDTDLTKVLGLLDHALVWRPHYAPALSARQWIDQLMGDDETGDHDAQRSLERFKQAPPNLAREEVDAQIARLETRLAEYKGAFLAASKITNPPSVSLPYEDEADLLTFSQAQNLALAHDPIKAQDTLKKLRAKYPFNPTPVDDVFVQWGNSYAPDFFIDIDQGNWSSAVKVMQHADDVAAQKGCSVLYYKRTWFDPLLAYANAKAGDRARADGLISATPQNCYLCLRMQGRIAVEEGHWQAAHIAFEEAIKRAPSLPAAHVDFGDALLAEGLIPKAGEQYSIAERLGRESAEPFERSGEVLLRERRWSDAGAKFAHAELFAPEWGRLHLAAAKAWAKLKKTDQQQRELNIGAHSIVSPEDRKALDAL